MTEVERFMGRARRRWTSTTTLRRASQGGVAGGLTGAAMVLAGGPRPLALGLVAAGLVLVPAALASRRPAEIALAARLDRAAGLGSTLTAAVEFRDRADPWCVAQRIHAARLLAGLDPAALLPWRGTGWLVAAVAALLAVTLLPPRSPSPQEGGGGRAEQQALRAAEVPSAPLPPGGAGGKAQGASSAPGTPPNPVADPTTPTPALPRGGRELATTTQALPRGGRGSGSGDVAGTTSTGDIGTGAATTPLLGAPDRALPRPGRAAILTLAGAALPGAVAAPPGGAPTIPLTMAPAPRPTLSLAPPEAVPLHLRATVARYFALLHPATEADEP